VPKKVFLMIAVIALFVLLQPVMAQEAAAAGSERGSANMWIALGAAFGLAIAAAACGIAQSIAIKSAADGIARNPGSADSIRGLLIIGLAFIESLVIYCLLIALIMLFQKWI
jgi:F-type H+-transporting ATPase subunit c